MYTARTDVEVAKEMLIHQYQANNINAIQQFGRRVAERLFPRDRHPNNVDATDSNTEYPIVTADIQVSIA